MLNTQRMLNIIAILCLAAVGFALFSQYSLDMQPCAWCVLLRFIFLVIALVCLLANLFRSPFILRLFSFLSFSLSVAGILSTWYQYSVASESFSCDMTFADIFMSRWTHLDALAPWIFGIYASCMDAKADLFGIEYSLWGMGLSAVLALGSLYALFAKNERDLFKAL
ncbi:disulfide bond formation protein B [Pelistega europaea]|uniref:Disulfide bond formation protein B n=1 Tax=Pelistega europaea TaxID=106147 RepID=A0A7Y4L8K9_9BURK|nr:disulfide bond formation protein B [Pelistega europaea]NOL48985.1 disulfide bond formation protein B [Pelistega europaea]